MGGLKHNKIPDRNCTGFIIPGLGNSGNWNCIGRSSGIGIVDLFCPEKIWKVCTSVSISVGVEFFKTIRPHRDGCYFQCSLFQVGYGHVAIDDGRKDGWIL